MASEYGVTNVGFRPKPFDVLFEDLASLFKQYLSPTLRLDVDSRVRRLIEILAYREQMYQQLLSDVYFSGFIETATGLSLDYLARPLGFARIPAQRAKGYVKFSRENTDEEIVIPAGTVVSTANGLRFLTTESKTMAQGVNEVEVEVIAEIPGSAGNIGVEEIVEIVTPVEGVDSVTNPYVFTGGRDKETDDEFRSRIKLTLRALMTATLPAIRDRVRAVPGVQDVIVEENVTMNDYREQGGLPPKSFRVIVLGGSDIAIANAIYETKPAGIQSYGSKRVTVFDAGKSYDIYFDRPEVVDIYVKVLVDPLVNVDLIKEMIMNYVNSLRIGEDVIYLKLAATISDLDFIRNIDIYVGTKENPSSKENIEISTLQVARTDADKIIVGQLES